MMSHFSLATFKILSLPLTFDSLTNRFLAVDVFYVQSTWSPSAS